MPSTHLGLRDIYKRLIGLFPNEFQERFGESLLDTFDDLISEEGVSPLHLYIDLSSQLIKERLMETNVRYVVVAVLAVLSGYMVRALNLQLPGSVYLLWVGILLGIGGLQTEKRTLAISAAIFGSVLALTLLLPKLASPADPRGPIVLAVLGVGGAIVGSVALAAAGFWARRIFTRA